MATPLTLTRLEIYSKKWKVNYKLFDSAAAVVSRGRRNFLVQYGVMNHHTGSDSGQSDDYDNFLFVRGRPEEGIPAPLCNISGDMDGEVHFGAMRVANHAGAGSDFTLNAIRNQNYDGYNKELNPGPDNINGNDVYLGIEWKYDGGQPPTPEMWESMVRLNAAICDAQGWTALAVLAHREHTERKNDPGNVLMFILRRHVRDLLIAGPEGGSDVALTEQEKKDIRNAGWLAEQFGQGKQFEEDFDIIQAFVTSLSTAEAARYADLKDTITQWSEAKDQARLTELVNKLEEHQQALLAASNQQTAALADAIQAQTLAIINAINPPE